MKLERIPKRFDLSRIGTFFLYLGVVFWFVWTPVSAMTPSLMTFSFAFVFSGLLLWAFFVKPASTTRYITVLAAFVLYITMWHYNRLDFALYNKVSFFFVIFYAYLLPDVVTPNLVGTAIALYYLTYIGDKTPERIFGTMAGLLIIAFSFGIVFHLLRKITQERNRYRDLTRYDSLTGVANLNYTLQVGQEILDKGDSLAVLVTDLDRFKQINDTYGHLVGNQVLIKVARLLESATEGSQRMVGRLGGDEFVVIFRECDAVQVLEISRRCSELMEETQFIVDPEIEPISISFSAGTAYAPPRTGLSMDKLLSTADMEMYYNKYENHRMNVYSKMELPLISGEGMQLLRVLSEKDMYTYVHSQYTAHFAASFARHLGLPEEEANNLYVAGWLHDIGKLLVPNDIIRKTSNLNDEEYELIKGHVKFGLSILADNNPTEIMKNAILFHHERWDGRGYPGKISGSEIPLEGRIMQLADAFSAMRVRRVYRRTLSLEEAIEEIRRNAGIQFDPELTSEFIRCIRLENLKKDLD